MISVVKRQGAPFVRLCEEILPGAGTSYATVWRALEIPVKKKGKGRGKSTIPERKKHRAVGPKDGAVEQVML